MSRTSSRSVSFAPAASTPFSTDEPESPGSLARSAFLAESPEQFAMSLDALMKADTPQVQHESMPYLRSGSPSLSFESSLAEPESPTRPTAEPPDEWTSQFTAAASKIQVARAKLAKARAAHDMKTLRVAADTLALSEQEHSALLLDRRGRLEEKLAATEAERARLAEALEDTTLRLQRYPAQGLEPRTVAYAPLPPGHSRRVRAMSGQRRRGRGGRDAPASDERGEAGRVPA